MPTITPMIVFLELELRPELPPPLTPLTVGADVEVILPVEVNDSTLLPVLAVTKVWPPVIVVYVVTTGTVRLPVVADSVVNVERLAESVVVPLVPEDKVD